MPSSSGRHKREHLVVLGDELVGSNLLTAAYLDDLATAFQDNPELHIQLVGHTDNVGSEKFNQRLAAAGRRRFVSLQKRVRRRTGA